MPSVAESVSAVAAPVLSGLPKPPPVQTRSDALQTPVYHIESRIKASQSGDFRYDKPARQIATVFRLTPPETHGAQKRISTLFDFAPVPHTQQHFNDAWGNATLETRHEAVEAHLTFVAELVVQNFGAYDALNRLLPQGIPAKRNPQPFLRETPLTTPNAALQEAVATVRETTDNSDFFALLVGLGGCVYRNMRFQSGVTGTRTTAVDAWQGKTGVCQDYTHILLTLCRLCGVPARYVSGFVPAEGAMHAWVEAANTDDEGKVGWYAFDPTHNRWVNERYVTVATGRDYHDILPTSGTYFGGASVLTHRSRAVVEETHRVEP